MTYRLLGSIFICMTASLLAFDVKASTSMLSPNENCRLGKEEYRRRLEQSRDGEPLKWLNRHFCLRQGVALSRFCSVPGREYPVPMSLCIAIAYDCGYREDSVDAAYELCKQFGVE